ncbi:hypothetical protein ACM26V_06960 [Salipaludibacillus sp. HK11]|uniref:hypothetical protein n=1 Tax=Salipaludibacillus sp. HK11 TaxID=3394320 RepID=UPI0039FD5034
MKSPFKPLYWLSKDLDTKSREMKDIRQLRKEYMTTINNLQENEIFMPLNVSVYFDEWKD